MLERPALAEALARRQRQRARTLHIIREPPRRHEVREVALVKCIHARRDHGPAPELRRRIQRDGGTMRHLTFKDRVVEEVQGTCFIQIRPPALLELEPALYG